MRLAILSDIHDNIWALDRALQRTANSDALLVLGDLCAPFTMAMLVERFAGPIHVVWGNNDGDRLRIAEQARRGDTTLHGEFVDLMLAGRRVALTHYPHIGHAVARNGDYDLVCYGHNHQRAQSQAGATLLLNPGEVMGRFGVSSIALYDTDTAAAEIIEY